MNNGIMENLSELHKELLKIKKVTNNITLDNKKISIVFHNEFKLEIVSQKITDIYYIYINSIFLCEIEEQDIIAFINEIINDSVIVQNKKMTPFKKSLNIILKKSFNLQNWKTKRNILIFTSEETLVNNF